MKSANIETDTSLNSREHAKHTLLFSILPKQEYEYYCKTGKVQKKDSLYNDILESDVICLNKENHEKLKGLMQNGSLNRHLITERSGKRYKHFVALDGKKD